MAPVTPIIKLEPNRHGKLGFEGGSGGGFEGGPD